MLHEYTASENKLRHLSEEVKQKHFEVPQAPGMQNKTLFSNLLARKLDRAKTSINRGLYSEAKKNLDAILKVDPNNAEAKQMLNSLSQ